MHLHILGICGTFMGGLAALAREAGHRVTGCDANVYPPMSDQLAALGIELIEGYSADQLELAPDLFVIGNALTRGNPLVEAILDANVAYASGPQWLADHVLSGRHVLAVAGTHGKTGTTAMLTWILERAGRTPGFLLACTEALHLAPATHREDALQRLVARIDDEAALPRHRAHEVVELALDRGEVVEDVGVVELEVVEDRGARPVVDELAALVEERGVVLVGLDHERRVARAEPRRDAEVARVPRS